MSLFQSMLGTNPRTSIAQVAAIVAFFVLGAVLYAGPGLLSFTQFAYYQVALCAVLLCYAMLDWKPWWAKLLAAQAFVVIGFLPRVSMPTLNGLIDLPLRAALLLLIVPLILIVVLCLGARAAAGRGPRLRAVLMVLACGVAGLLQVPLLPWLLHESLSRNVVGLLAHEEPLIQASPDAHWLLTSFAKEPETATRSATDPGLVPQWHGALPHDPIGVRFVQEEARLLMRGEVDENKRVALVCARLTKDGPAVVSTHSTIINWAPSPLSNPLSPDAAFVALNGGQFFAFETGKVHGDKAPSYHVGLEFVEWADSGTALYYDKAVNTVQLIVPGGNTVKHALRTVPASARSITLVPGGKKLLYEEIGLGGACGFVLQDLESEALDRIWLNRGLGIREDGARAWVTDTTLAYIDSGHGLSTLGIDTDRKTFRHRRRSQLFDVVLGLATSPERRKLFWTTVANERATLVHHQQLP